MATPEQPSMPVNGNYAPHQAQTYGSMDSNYNAANANSASYGAAPSSTSSHAVSGNGGAPEIPKDEVGWYFVEQYYTTLSRSPEKLYVRIPSPLVAACISYRVTANISASFSTTSARSLSLGLRRRNSQCASVSGYVHKQTVWVTNKAQALISKLVL